MLFAMENNRNGYVEPFKYTCQYDSFTKDITFDIQLPLDEYQTACELATYYCTVNNIPYCYQDDIFNALKMFIQTKMDYRSCLEDDALVETSFQKQDKDVPFDWANIPKSLDKYKKKQRSSNKVDEKALFAQYFQFVMQNCAHQQLHMIIQKEVKMAQEMSQLIRDRDVEVGGLTKERENEIKKCTTADDASKISSYALSTLNEKIRVVTSNYTHQIEELKARQKNDFRVMIKTLYETDTIPNHIQVGKGTTLQYIQKFNSLQKNYEAPKTLEIFTIYLGAQLKSMHNVRILSCDDLSDLCLSHTPPMDMDEHIFDSQRLNTLTQLYRRGQNGVVLLVERDPMYHLYNKTNFYKICEKSTELHFDCLEVQLEEARDAIIYGNHIRNVPKRNKYVHEIDEQTPIKLYDINMYRSGDLYVTRHSNLSQTQIVFHLVGESELETEDISSKHPILNGLRNTIRSAARNGVTNLYVPLLLVTKTLEHMTIPWCLKRAELVFKCIKGYLMEICNTGSSSSTPGGITSHNTTYTINFILPNGLSSTVYGQLIDMFPTIYHLVPSVNV
uniref:RING-type domain-containing protein n=1 Tax=Rhabditophanes sp. KR3021 TaxID=114890 RepID=A0AC35U1U0_9BILA